MNDAGDSTDDFERQLRTLASRTEHVAVRADFTERVMTAVALEATQRAPTADPVDTTWRLGWRVLPAALLAATVALLFAVQSSSLYDDALVSTYDEMSVELSW